MSTMDNLFQEALRRTEREAGDAQRIQSSCAVAWRTEAEALNRLGIAGDAARTLARCAKELDDAIAAANGRLVSLGEAAVISGYSPDHLSRLISRGVISNAGRKGKPLIKAGDIPRRARVARPGAKEYDPTTDARSLRVRGRRKK